MYLQQDLFSPVGFVAVLQEQDKQCEHSLADTWELIILERHQWKKHNQKPQPANQETPNNIKQKYTPMKTRTPKKNP